MWLLLLMLDLRLNKSDLCLHSLERASVRRLRDVVMALAMNRCPWMWTLLVGCEERQLDDAAAANGL